MQNVASGACIGTKRTFVRPLTGVSTFVHFQVVVSDGGIGALIAFMRPLICVRKHVST